VGLAHARGTPGQGGRRNCGHSRRANVWSAATPVVGRTSVQQDACATNEAHEGASRGWPTSRYQSATRSLLRSTSHLYRLSLQTRLFGPRVHGGLDQHVDGPSLVAERAPVKWNKDRSRQSVIANAAADARLGCETEPVRHLSRTAHRHTVVLRRRLLHRGTAIECHPRAEVARTKYR
jgi:hypothetical protein